MKDLAVRQTLRLTLQLTVALCLGIPAVAAPQAPHPASESLMHVTTSFDLVVHAPLPQAAQLFGPEGERAWAGEHWDPQFIHPRPARDTEGAVFTIKHGPLSAVWVTTRFDLEARHFQYVYFLPGLLVTTIDVRFLPVNSGTTHVNVIYTRTAVTPEGNAHVVRFTEQDKRAGQEWQESIDKYLARQKQANRGTTQQ